MQFPYSLIFLPLESGPCLEPALGDKVTPVKEHTEQHGDSGKGEDRATGVSGEKQNASSNW